MAQQRMWVKSRTFRESLQNAWRGVVYGVRSESNMRIQLVIYLLAFILAWWLNLSLMQAAIIALGASLVLVMEMVNTVIEDLANVVQPKYHGRVKHLKDLMAGAVLIASLTAFLIGLFLFGPPLIALLVG